MRKTLSESIEMSIERKIIKVSARKETDWRKDKRFYSSWVLWIDIWSSQYENLDHDYLYQLIKPSIQTQWPNIDINCGACSGGKPPNSDGSCEQNKDFYINFKNSIDEAEFILENQILVGKVI